MPQPHGSRQYVYLVYRREGYKDIKEFEEEMRPLALKASADIMIDLTGFVALSSPEIGVLVRTANRLSGSGCVIRIITSPELIETLTRTNLDRLPTIAMYPDRGAAQAAVENHPR